MCGCMRLEVSSMLRIIRLGAATDMGMQRLKPYTTLQPRFLISPWNSFGLEWHRRESGAIDEIGPCRFIPCKPDGRRVVNQ